MILRNFLILIRIITENYSINLENNNEYCNVSNNIIDEEKNKELETIIEELKKKLTEAEIRIQSTVYININSR